MGRRISISELNHKISLDASDLDQGLVASRKEIRDFNRALKDLRTPMEVYEDDLKKAESLLKFGADGQELYNRAIERAEQRYRDLSGATDEQREAEEALNRDRRLAARLIDDQTDELTKLQREMNDVNRLYDQNLLDARQYRHELERLERQMRDVRQEGSLFNRLGSEIGGRLGLDGVLGAGGSRVAGQMALIAGGIALADTYVQTIARAGEFAVDRINQDREAIDAIGKEAQAIGISIEKLTAIQFAAGETSGLTGDQTIKAMRELTKRSSEAAAGMGEAGTVLDELNLSAAELNQLEPDRRLEMVANSMQTVENRADRLRIASKLFGEEQGRIVNLLSLGAEGVNTLIDEAERKNLIITEQEYENVAAMNDSIAELGLTLNRFSQKFTAEAADEIMALTESLISMSHILLENKELLDAGYDLTIGQNLAMANLFLNRVNSSIRYNMALLSPLIGSRPDTESELEQNQSLFGNSSMLANQVDPAESITQGSRQAFDIQFRTDVNQQMAIRQAQLEEQRRIREATEASAERLGLVASAMTGGERL